MASRKKETLRYVGAGAYDDDAPLFDFVREYLYENSLVFIFGPPGSGKTFFTMHLLCSTALGRPVFGLTTDKRRCLYIGLEGDAGIKSRIAAWCVQNRVDSNPIHYARGPLNLGDESGSDVDDVIDYAKKHRIGFIALDTFAMATAGLDEVSGAHMTFALNQLHRIRAETGACVLAVHHTGKDQTKGLRGHSSLLGNSDTVIELQVHAKDASTAGEAPVTNETPRSATVKKQRDGRTGKRLHFGLIERETPFSNARGETVTSLAVDENERFSELPAEEEGAAPARKPSKRERDAADILDALNRKLGRAGPASLDQLRRALKREKWGPDNPTTWRSAFRDLKARMEMGDHDAVLHIS